jgi:hypothetical protein
MPRPISWLPRLHEIRRSVINPVRSRYDRDDLERFFEVQPRSAQLLLELLGVQFWLSGKHWRSFSSGSPWPRTYRED